MLTLCIVSLLDIPFTLFYYPRRARSAIGVDTVLTLDVCLYVCMYVTALQRKRLIGMT